MNDDECITVSKTGKRERRVYVNSGRFLIYDYLPEDGKGSKKMKIILKDNGGEQKEFFIIPTKGKKYLVFQSESKGERGVFKDGKCINIEELL